MRLSPKEQRILRLIMLGHNTSNALSIHPEMLAHSRLRLRWVAVDVALRRLENLGLISRGPRVRGVKRPISLTRRAFFDERYP